MAINILPTLSMSGWVSSVSEKSDRLLAYFFEADGYQSSLYSKGVYCLQKIISEFNGDAAAITKKVEDALNDYMSNYFDAVIVETSHDISEGGDININIYVRVAQDGKEYSIGKLLVLGDNTIKRIISLNN